MIGSSKRLPSSHSETERTSRAQVTECIVAWFGSEKQFEEAVQSKARGSTRANEGVVRQAGLHACWFVINHLKRAREWNKCWLVSNYGAEGWEELASKPVWFFHILCKQWMSILGSRNPIFRAPRCCTMRMVYHDGWLAYQFKSCACSKGLTVATHTRVRVVGLNLKEQGKKEHASWSPRLSLKTV